MPADKDAAKRRRQARNRQERAARQARTEGAKRAANRPSRKVEERPGKGGGKGATTSLAKDGDAPAPASGGLLGKLFPPRADTASGSGSGSGSARRGPTPSVVVAIDDEELTGPRRFLARAAAQPGGRAVMLASLVAVVSFVVMLVSPIWPIEVLEPVARQSVEVGATAQDLDVDEVVADFDDGQPVFSQGTMSESIYPVPIAVALAILPLLLALIAVSSLAKPTRSRTLLWCALGGAFVGLFGGGGPFALPVAVVIGWGAWQSRKADQVAAAEQS